MRCEKNADTRLKFGGKADAGERERLVEVRVVSFDGAREEVSGALATVVEVDEVGDLLVELGERLRADLSQRFGRRDGDLRRWGVCVR